MGLLMDVIRRFRLLAALTVAALAGLTSSAVADVQGHGNDESTATAVTLSWNTPVSGAFQDSTYPSNPDGQGDQDYLAFSVAYPGQVLSFKLQNTTSGCNAIDVNLDGCPVYDTLMDSTGQSQVGGSTSGAGDQATAGDTETFTWKFTSAGSYYVLLENDGGLPNGYPSYTFTLGAPKVHASGLRLSHAQGSSRAKVRFHLASTASFVKLSVRTAPRSGRARAVMARTLTGVRGGSHTVSFGLPRWLRHLLSHAGSVRVKFSVTTTSASGSRSTASRHFTLRR
jgi:hypothetical protein